MKLHPAYPTAALLVLILAASAGCIAAPEPEPENVTEIIIGTATENYPFAYIDRLGTLTGSDVEIAAWIAENAGINVTILPMPFSELIPALKTEKIDIILGGMIITPEREQQIDFVREYPAAIHLAAGAAVTSSVSREAVLNGNAGTAAVLRGSTAELWAEQTLPDGNVLVCSSYDECAEAVNNGTAQIMIANEITIRSLSLQAQHPIAFICPIYTENSAVGAGIRKNDTASMQFITDALERFYASDEAQMLSLKYGISLQKPLRIGLAEDNYPYGYRTGAGTLAGMDIDVLSWICETSGTNPEFTVTSLQTLPSLLETGDIDVAAAGLVIGEDLKKTFDFVKEYPYPAYIGLLKKTGNHVTRTEVLNGNATITAVEGSAAAAWARAEAGTQSFVPGYGDSSCRILLTTAKADVYAGDQQTLQNIAKESPAEYTYLGTIYTKDDTIGLALRPESTELKELLITRLAMFYASGAGTSTAAKYDITLNEPFKVGAATDNPPFTYVEHGAFNGIDIDTLDWMANDAGLRFRIVPMEWEELIPAVTKGDVDVAISGLTATEERRKQVYFTTGILPSTLAFGAKLDSGLTYYDLSSGNYNITVVASSLAQEWATATLPKDAKPLKVYDSIDKAIAAVVYGSADAVLDDELVIKTYTTEHPETFETVCTIYLPNDLAFAVYSSDFTLLLKLNEEIKKLKETDILVNLKMYYGLPLD